MRPHSEYFCTKQSVMFEQSAYEIARFTHTMQLWHVRRLLLNILLQITKLTILWPFRRLHLIAFSIWKLNSFATEAGHKGLRSNEAFGGGMWPYLNIPRRAENNRLSMKHSRGAQSLCQLKKKYVCGVVKRKKRWGCLCAKVVRAKRPGKSPFE